ncbi:MAG: nucleotidyltransferase family protein [Ruminococcaceae bacterium]|nr:nucleotidyltransferase family protein [Oscillospiraceae bacterium]
MKAVILAGGKGSRLYAVTRGEVPKPMVPLGGRPVLEWLILRLRQSGIRHICCTLQCLPDQIRDYFGDGSAFGVHMEYRQETEPLGTAGAVKNCRDFVGNEPFFVLSGDGVFDFDLRALMEAHRRHESDVTMALSPLSAPLSYGLALTDSEGHIRGFIEKPIWEKVVTDLVNTGIYVLSPAVLDEIPANTAYDFARDLFPKLLEAGRPLFGLPMEGYWRDIGEPESYYRCNLDALSGKLQPADRKSPARTEAPVTERRRRYRCSAVVETPQRARLMRELSAALMEAGADFTDGITLTDAPGGLHIAPQADEECILVESDDPATAERYKQIADNLPLS